MARILLIYSNDEFPRILGDALFADNHSVEICHDCEQASAVLAYSEFELIILASNISGESGLSICASLRAKGATLPIIYIGAGETIDEKQAAFEAGVDDYLTDTFNVRELSFRVGALLRRTALNNPQNIRYADLELDSKRRIVSRGVQEIRLSPKECALLDLFLRHPGRVFSSVELLRSVWFSETAATDQVLRTTIKRLRQRIDKSGCPSYIRNEYAHGYRLEQASVLSDNHIGINFGLQAPRIADSNSNNRFSNFS